MSLHAAFYTAPGFVAGDAMGVSRPGGGGEPMGPHVLGGPPLAGDTAPAQDKTARLQQELADARASLAFLTTTLDSMTDGVVAIQFANGARCYNRRFLEMWRIPAGEVRSGCHRSVIDACAAQVADRDHYIASVERMLRRPEQCSDLVELKDGRTFERHITPQKVEGEVVGLVVNFRDITERKKVAGEMARQRALLSSLVNAIPDTIGYKDPHGVYLGCNEAFAQLVGVPVHEVAGRTDQELFVPEVAERHRQGDREILATLCKRVFEEHEPLEDGRRRVVEKIKTPFWDPEGRLLGVIGIGRDVTARQEAQDATRRAKELAEEATRMKSAFLANMSHEIRTPMNAVIGLSHLALKTELTARQRDYLSKIRSSGQHLLGLINDILDFSKVEAGQLAMEREPFELASMLDNVGNLLAQKADEKGLGLDFEVAPDVPGRLVGDSLRLGQILINYASNAIKFTPQGRIRVQVQLRERGSGGALLHFSVSDTGIGLTAEQVSRLFQKFQQADASTTRKFGGTGLGLAISKALAELMGGQVGVHSVPGQGSTFWFTARLGLPEPVAVAAPAAAPQDELARQLASRAGARVLVVEDNDINQIVAAEILRDAGLVPEVADNGQIALDMLASNRYDLVLMDMQMPVMDGLTATERIRAQDELRTLPIVAMTANAMGSDRDRCLQAGMNDYVVKPFEPDDLWRVLLKWLPAR